MDKEQGRCEVADCGIQLIGNSFFDHYFKKRVCPSCWEKHFRAAEDHAWGEFFEANFDKTAYPQEFWNKVGAFVDLSKAEPKGAYK